MDFTMHDIPTKYRHPDLDQFQAKMKAIDFCARFDALCAAHPNRGPEVPVASRQAALEGTGRRWVFHRFGRYWAFRERERYPKHCGLGLDLRIDARVELALLFATPRGYFSAPFARIARDLRRLDEPGFVYKPAHPAPRIGTADELPAILTESIALYDLVADAIRSVPWWWPDEVALCKSA